MKTIAIAAVSCLLPMLALDGFWLSCMLKRFYAPRMSHLMADSPLYAAAGVFYLIYAAGLAILVVAPAVQSGAGTLKVFLTGAIFGLVCYATYDLTNQATLKAWPLAITLVDMAWGTLLSGTVSLIACALTRHCGT